MITSDRRLRHMLERSTVRKKGALQRAQGLAKVMMPAIAEALGADKLHDLANLGSLWQANPGQTNPQVTVPQTPTSSSLSPAPAATPSTAGVYYSGSGLGGVLAVGSNTRTYDPAEMMRLLSSFTTSRMTRKVMPDGSVRDQHPEFIELPFPPVVPGQIEHQDPTGQWIGEPALGIAFILPDGSELVPDGKGGCEQVASDGTVTYRPCSIRNFNRFLNASDLVDEFIRALGTAGMKQDQVLKIPLGPFIHWLIGKAAEADGDPVPADIPPVKHDPQLAMFRKEPRCKLCGRFLPKRMAQGGMFFCSGRHMDRYAKQKGMTA